MKKISMCIALLLLIMALSSPVAGAQVNLELNQQLNFNSGLEDVYWNLLQVKVTNRGTEDWQGMAVVTYSGTYKEEIFVPAGKTIEVEFYLPPFSVTTFLGDVGRRQLELVGTDGSIVKSEAIDAGSAQHGMIIGVLTTSTESFTRLTNIYNGATVVNLHQEYFTQRAFMDNFSLLVISDGQLMTLQAGQKDNLTSWVQRGGILVVGGGRGWQGNVVLIPPEILPFKPTGTREMEDVLPFSGEILAHPYVVSTGNATGEVLLSVDSVPLLVANNYGRGRVFYATLNLEDSPFTDATTQESFWRFVYESGGERLYDYQASRDNYALPQFLNLISMAGEDASFFSPTMILIGLLLYILIIGPLSYVILRRLRRWDWGWLTIPVVAIVFTVLIYATASSSRGNEYALYEINFLDVQGNKAIAESYGALFIPQRSDVSFTTAGGTVAPGRGVEVTRGATVAETILQIDNPPLWSMQRLYGERALELEGTIDLQATMGIAKVEVTVKNDTVYPLFESYVRFGRGWQTVGALAPGESKAVVLNKLGGLDMTRIYQHYNQNTRYQPYWPEELFSSTLDLLFVGFNDDVSVMNLSGVEQTTPLSIFSTGLQVREMALEEKFSIQDGWLKPLIIHPAATNVPAHMGGKMGNELYLNGNGQLDLIFPLPQNIDYTQGNYQLNLTVNGHGSTEILVYNNVQDEWEQIGMMTPGNSVSSYTLQHVEQLVQGDRLRVRLKYDGDLWLDTTRLFSVQGGVLK
ncbi:MAG: hypothetical protein NUK65_07310 [Firmicutes bacterium]|nr:hypothetical protein [Bacillota bacterium]